MNSQVNLRNSHRSDFKECGVGNRYPITQMIASRISTSPLFYIYTFHRVLLKLDGAIFRSILNTQSISLASSPSALQPFSPTAPSKHLNKNNHLNLTTTPLPVRPFFDLPSSTRNPQPSALPINPPDQPTLQMPPPHPPTPYVTLISNDGFEFILRRESACIAGTINRMLDPSSTF